MTIVVIGDNTGDDFAGTEDTEIYSETPGTNYINDTTWETTNWSSTQVRRTLLKFSGLSNIPSGAAVNSATVSIYKNVDFGATFDVAWNRVLRDWVESEATWNSYSSGNGWQTAGATGANDIAGTASASLSVGTATGQYFDFTGAQLDQDVDDFINGVSSNYGWLGQRSDGKFGQTAKIWVASKGTDGQRPKLTVDYTAGGGDPGGDDPVQLIKRRAMHGGLIGGRLVN